MFEPIYSRLGVNHEASCTRRSAIFFYFFWSKFISVVTAGLMYVHGIRFISQPDIYSFTSILDKIRIYFSFIILYN
jgi:hypothetical protein